MTSKCIHIAALTEAERQAFADFQYKELLRHEDDCNNIRNDLQVLAEKYGIEPRHIYVGKWLECK